MSTTTVQPTSNTTPDPGQGGSAVTGNINTGHGSTVTSDAATPGTTTKTCIWQGFANSLSGQRQSVTLKLDWTEDGSLPDGGNSFTVQYSLNNGSSWNSGLDHADVIAPNNGSLSISLPAGQDLSQVRVRDKMTAAAATFAASITTSIANIQIEVVTLDAPAPIVMM